MKKQLSVGQVNFVPDNDWSVYIELTCYDEDVFEGRLVTETKATITDAWVNTVINDDKQTVTHLISHLPTTEKDIGFNTKSQSFHADELVAVTFNGKPLDVFYDSKPVTLPEANPEKPTEFHGRLRLGVEENGEYPNHLYGNNHGEPIQLCGLSFFWSGHSDNGHDLTNYWHSGACEKAALEFEAPLVRAAMSADELADPNNYYVDPVKHTEMVDLIVEEATANGQYVIVDFHSHDADRHLTQALTFFTQAAEKYVQHTNVIYEIFNEPIEQEWSVIKDYAEQVIAAIREVDKEALILVGTGNYSQQVDEAIADPILDGDKPAHNVMYTFHYYGTCVDEACHNDLKPLLQEWAMQVPIFISEYGHSDPTGGGTTIDIANNEAWYDIVDDLGLSSCHWSFSDKNELSAMFDHTTALTAVANNDELLTESGELIRDRLIDLSAYSNPQASIITLPEKTAPKPKDIEPVGEM